MTQLAEKPRLLFFFESHDGRARRVDGYLAQVLQRRKNHDAFVVHRLDVVERPDLAERFRVDETPTLVIVHEKRVCGRLHHPRNAVQIQTLLDPWLR